MPNKLWNQMTAAEQEVERAKRKAEFAALPKDEQAKRIRLMHIRDILKLNEFILTSEEKLQKISGICQ